MNHVSPLVSLLTFRRIPLALVGWTAAASAIMTAGMVYLNQPLYLIALAALLPWMPVMLFESLWKIKHYHWIAIFGVIMMLQLGHVVEHVVQVAALMFTESTLVCPPPVDTTASAQRTIDAGLRSPGSRPTGLSASVVVRPTADGFARMDSNGQLVIGPPACGVFGQLDLEIVHLVWELAGWLLLLTLMVQFPRNRWLWLAVILATIHTFEHLFICFTFFLDPSYVYDGSRQIWGTLVDGSIVTAYPLGKEAAVLNFYDVAGRFGIAAKNGLIGTFFPAINASLPERPYLHLYYNALVTLPALIGFIVELRTMHDRYLAKALPGIKQQAMASVTPVLEYQRYQPGEMLTAEGEMVRHVHIIAEGTAYITREDEMKALPPLGPLSIFGDGEASEAGRSPVTIRALTSVEIIRMPYQTFEYLLKHCAQDRSKVVERVLREYTRWQQTHNLTPQQA